MGIFSNVDEFFSNAKNSGNFDDLINKTKNYAEGAVKKSAETIEISKKKIELLDAKTKLAKAYESFGKLQYSALEESVEIDEATLQASLEEIKLLKSRADILSAEADDLKSKFVDSLKKKEAEWEARRQERAEANSPANDIEVTVVEHEDE